MRAFVVLGLVFSIPSQETGLGKHRKTTTQTIDTLAEAFSDQLGIDF